MAPVPTYYDVLQVERDASPEGIRRAWRKLAQTYHPDKMPGNANAARAMAAINAAYEILSDPHRRAEHDVWIGRAESPRSAVASRTRVREDAWPWYLLFATMAFAVGTVGTALYLSIMPLHGAVPPRSTAASAPVTITLATPTR
jgi:curved DNA-binding protein CbpA